ncbi:hypothetical protein BC941DRAFT_350521 [Chlamydoabsidia padenii]|nr:hypothetical protein BC941DRAFT_350521 [Chlamydoabsidia padenii]
MHRFYTDDPTLTFDDCLYQLKHDIIAAPATCGPWARILASTMAAFAASIIMFEGSWIDSGFSALFGLVIGGLKELANWMPVYARVFEVSACTLASLAVRSLHNYCCFNATIISSIIILLPGYAMTMAVMEITSKHMVAGAVRLIHVVFYSFLLAYGLELGSYLYDAFYPNTSTDGYCPVNNAPYSPVVPPEWAIIPLFPVMTCGLSMTFGSAPRQWPSEIIAAALGFGATYFLRRFIPDPPILNAISSFLVGLYGHVALKLTGQPPISPISVGVSMLVPGSIGVRGAFGMLHQSEEGKSNFALQMLNIAIGLSVGLFASGMVIYPAGKRRSLYISL